MMLTATQAHKFEWIMAKYHNGELALVARHIRKMNKVDLAALILHSHAHETVGGWETQEQGRRFHQYIEQALEGYY